MTQRLEFTRPMMRRRAGLYANEARRQLLKECQNVAALELTANDHIAVRIDAMNLENGLCDVETDRRDRLHGCLLRIRPPHRRPWHLRAGGGAVHSIINGLMQCSKTAQSITLSARASTVAGRSMPSSLAVLRLITSWHLFRACTGRLRGFAPLRMRSTKWAAWQNWWLKSAPYETSPPLSTSERSQ